MSDFQSRKGGGVGGWLDEDEDGWRGEVNLWSNMMPRL